jgi:Domain of unknown function (DUF4838)
MILTSHTSLRNVDFDDETLALAFQELAGFLSQSPGCQVSDQGGIKVTFTVQGDVGYSVLAKGDELRFIGSTPVEILYAVYTLAEEELGFCFFEPGQDRVEKKSQVQFDDGVVIDERVPLMKRRGLIQEYPCDESNYRLADWMVKNRLNYLMTWMKFYDQFTDDLKVYYRVRGIEIESGHHNFEYYLPVEEYSEEHPEYFAIIDGKRVQSEPGDADLFLSKQLCVTNPDVRAALAEKMISYVRAHPELRTISLMPNDGFGWCECEECSKFYDPDKRGKLYCVSEHVYVAQDIYHDLVQDVAARVHRELPDINISLAAYINYAEPSDRLELTRGLAVHMAPYWRCINHSIHDPNCPINRGYLQTLRRWGQVTKGGEFNVYEYYMGVNFYLSLPFVHHEPIFAEMRALRDAGADGILTQFHLPHWTAYGLNYVMMAKAAYGEDVSVVPAYMSKLFGADAADAQEFYRALREVVLSAGPCHIPIPRMLLNRTRREQYGAVRAQAQALCDSEPDDRLRQNLVVWIDYIIQFKDIYDRYQAGEDVRKQLQELGDWVEEHQEHDICMLPRLRTYFAKWSECISANIPWYHFNIDWEDEYVKRYDDLLSTPATDSGTA